MQQGASISPEKIAQHVEKLATIRARIRLSLYQNHLHLAVLSLRATGEALIQDPLLKSLCGCKAAAKMFAIFDKECRKQSRWAGRLSEALATPIDGVVTDETSSSTTCFRLQPMKGFEEQHCSAFGIKPPRNEVTPSDSGNTLFGKTAS